MRGAWGAYTCAQRVPAFFLVARGRGHANLWSGSSPDHPTMDHLVGFEPRPPGHRARTGRRFPAQLASGRAQCIRGGGQARRQRPRGAHGSPVTTPHSHAILASIPPNLKCGSSPLTVFLDRRRGPTYPGSFAPGHRGAGAERRGVAGRLHVPGGRFHDGTFGGRSTFETVDLPCQWFYR